MKVVCIQNAPKFGAKEKNFQEVRSLLNKVKADLIVLPELFATGYTFTSKAEAKELAETNHGKTAEFLKELSIKTGATIIGGFVEIEDEKIYNSALIVSENKVIDTYRKIHLFNKEKLWFEPGDKPLKVYDVKGMKIGVMICFDWMFPEVCRTLTLLGMQVLAHPSNLVMPYCQNAMVTRCLENRIFAITSNRIGREKRGQDDFNFTGMSQITNFNGEILSSAPDKKTDVLSIEIDPNKAKDKMINDFNNLLDDRRLDFYKTSYNLE
ncbi:nitrilase-related carbon-nitrogen hydrolase [Ancylomarina sp. 16SWW S1-10-2]|uniref:nitrilase-related carbon-nitrogen hydrolase n=1 Tax=Ancylomarina sp. 16SWW S1-10-2 TaxID=2499681 RepID=UPI0012AE703B|nr:nitrilase-related carbon-nitrogen hydrolase [Ancylomarina sp. 16SWW S1-10-2]MRT93647.1 acyltransferase [Ancylomarina sp. 16SWW S1-10-2]